MPQVTFRITSSILKQNIDLINELQKLGTNLFLVQHLKPENYHYHGLLDITISTKTFRRKLSDLSDPSFSKQKGFRYIVIGEQVNDADAYKSYCLYRPGHPIEETYIENENIKVLKDISDNKMTTKSQPKGKLDKDLAEMMIRCKSHNLKAIAYEILTYYKELGRVIHICDIQRLIWSVYAYNRESSMTHLVNHILTDEKAGFREIPNWDEDYNEPRVVSLGANAPYSLC